MNYAKHYEKLITRARARSRPSVFEIHHVAPKCLGGADTPDNRVALTPEEHFVAHQLLVKMHLGHRGLVYAAWAMSHLCYRREKCVRNKLYSWLRLRFRSARRASMLGVKLSDQTRARMRATHRQRWASMSTEERARWAEVSKKNAIKQWSGETSEARANVGRKVAEKLKGTKHKPETLAKRSAALRQAWSRRKSKAVQG